MFFNRSFKLDYVKETEIDGIPVYEYETEKNIFDNGTLVPGNECYCAGKCLNSGVFNVSACKFGEFIKQFLR